MVRPLKLAKSLASLRLSILRTRSERVSRLRPLAHEKRKKPTEEPRKRDRRCARQASSLAAAHFRVIGRPVFTSHVNWRALSSGKGARRNKCQARRKK